MTLGEKKEGKRLLLPNPSIRSICLSVLVCFILLLIGCRFTCWHTWKIRRHWTSHSSAPRDREVKRLRAHARAQHVMNPRTSEMSEEACRINNSLCCHDRSRAVTEKHEHLKGSEWGSLSRLVPEVVETSLLIGWRCRWWRWRWRWLKRWRRRWRRRTGAFSRDD